MRYCPTCEEEYRDDVAVCSDDGTPLTDHPLHPETDNDLTRLSTVITLDDRFEADELAQQLADEGFDVALVTNRSPTIGTLTTPGPLLYSVVVPDAELAKATALITEWRQALEEGQPDAESAAEREEAAGEAESTVS